MGTSDSGSSGLGSHAQSARGKQLSQARGTLIAIGILTIVVNAIFFYLRPGQIDEEIQKEIRAQGPGAVVNKAKVDEFKDTALRTIRIVDSVGVGLGIVFVALGAFVYQAPVLTTVLGLVLYVGAALIFGLMNPQSIAQGVVIKVLIIVGLAKAVQSALAYQKEASRESA